MPFDDPQVPNQPVSNDQAPAATAAPVTPASPSTPPPTPASGPANGAPSGNDQAMPTFQQNPNRSIRPGQDQVSNATAPVTEQPHADNASVQRAGVIHSIAQALAGGPRYAESIDDSGNRIYTRVKMSRKDIGLAIALEALTGSLAGLAGGRGKGMGAAGMAGMNATMQQAQQARQLRDQKAQQDFQNRSRALVDKANLADLNARIGLNVAESEKIGVDMIDKQVENNRASGVLDVDPINLENSGQPLTQAEILDGMKSGKFNISSHIGAMAGRVPVTGPDGRTRWEATFLLFKNPNARINISQEQFDRYASANVPGFPAGSNVSNGGLELKLSQVQRANEILAAHTLADSRLDDMRTVLNGTPLADKIPTKVDFSKPGVETAMTRFQKYVSHSDQHGMDVLQSIEAMNADRRDPRTGQMAPNADAKYADIVAAAMGGWPVLEATHNQLIANKKAATDFAIIDSEAKANAVIASPNKFTRDQISSAKNFLTLTQQQGARKTAEDARARAVAEGKDTEAMYKTGRNPITGERLSIDNAPDGAFVDAKGRVIPQNQQSFYKPSQSEKQTADTAKQVLAISADLRAAVQKNPNLVGPLMGNSKKGLASLGLGDAASQKMLDDVAFLQSAATKMHTSRFSNEILKKMSSLIEPGMNTQQFIGGLNSIDEVANRYAKEDTLVTVGDYKSMQQPPANNIQAPPVSLLKQGVNTTFANGQVWTLLNGQPTQVK
jgi:hypothetical protein